MQPSGQPQLPFPPLELVSRDELESIHQAALNVLKEIGIDFLHDEARATLKTVGADVDPSLASRSLRPRSRRSAHRSRAAGVQAARAQFRPRSLDRRTACRFRHGGERPQFVRPRGRAASRQQARLSELHPAWAEFRFDSFHRRLSGRADRHSRLDPPSRRAVRHADAVRQAGPRLQPRARAQPGRDRDGQDCPWARRRDAGARAFAVHGHQLVVAIEARHADGGRNHPDGAAQPGGGDDAVHPRRRDGAGDARRRAR